ADTGSAAKKTAGTCTNGSSGTSPSTCERSARREELVHQRSEALRRDRAFSVPFEVKARRDLVDAVEPPSPVRLFGREAFREGPEVHARRHRPRGELHPRLVAVSQAVPVASLDQDAVTLSLVVKRHRVHAAGQFVVVSIGKVL